MNSSKKKKMKKMTKNSPGSSQCKGGVTEKDENDESEELRVLNYLAEAFSFASVEEIDSAYRNSYGDPNKAAEILGGLLEGGDSQTSSSKPRYKGCKQKKIVASTGTVSSVLGKSYVNGDLRNGDGNNGYVKWKEITKGFAVGNEEAEEFLCSMLGDGCQLDMGVIKDVLSHCGYDVEKALDTLLDLSASSYNKIKDGGCGDNDRNHEHDMGFGLEREESLLTDRTSDSTFHPSEMELHGILQSAGYDFRDDTKFLVNSKENSPSRSATTKLDVQQKVLQSLFKIPESSEREPSCMNWKTVAKKMESFGQGLEFHSASITMPQHKTGPAKDDDYQVLRRDSSQHWNTMKSYYQKAATAFSRGERVHASYLSEQGKIYNKLACEADEKASQEIFEVRNKDIQNTVTIDLHGQHCKQAIRLMKVHLLLFMYIPSIQFLKVITGCGRHGVGKGKLKQSVIGLVKKEGIEWSEENQGTVVIKLDGPKEFSFMNSESDSDEIEG